MIYEGEYLKKDEDISKVIVMPSLVEWCIIIAVCLMPFTSLKGFMRIGPAELLILAVFITLLIRNQMVFPGLSTFISKGYAQFMGACGLGLGWSIFSFIVFRTDLPIRTIRFEFMSYVFVLMLIITVEMLQDSELKRLTASQMLGYIVNISFVSMLILFVISRSRSVLFGMPLLYHGRFTPLALNLHHTAMYLLPLTFLTVFTAERQHNIVLKLIYWAMAFLFGYMALLTDSTKAVMGVYLGAIICGFYKLTTGNGNINNRIKLLIIVIIVGAFIYTAFNTDKIFSFLINFFQDNDNGDARQTLWTRGIEIWKKSPIVGWGFGTGIPDRTIPGKYWDAHNSFVAVMLGGGLLGLATFLTLWVRILRQSVINGYILAANVSLFVYCSGGDVLRRIPVWFFIILSFYIIQGIEEEIEQDLEYNIEQDIEI